MVSFKRIFLLIALNFLIVIGTSLVLSLTGVYSLLQQHGFNPATFLVFCFAYGLVAAFISLFLSKIVAKWVYNIRLISPYDRSSEGQMLYKIVEKISLRANLKRVPEVGIFNCDTPNAFATGYSKKNSLVAVSSGLLKLMTPEEIEGVIGHEITHITNGDMVTMTLLQGTVNAFVLYLSYMLSLFLINASKKEDSAPLSFGAFYLLRFLFEIIFMILGSLLIAAFSRYREFKADKGGALLAGKPAMIHALEKLQMIEEGKIADNTPKGIAALCLVRKKWGLWQRWFSTHPPMDLRIKHLQELNVRNYPIAKE